MKHLKIFFFWLACLTGQLNAHDAFYAISSLRFLLDDQEKTIVCENDDIARLWDRASLDQTVSAEIEEAHSLYYQSGNTEAANAKLEQAWIILQDDYFNLRVRDDAHYPNLTDNPLFTEKIREQVNPYLMPLNHHMKPVLDDIFSRSRAIESLEALENAGFHTISKFIAVARHPSVPGYLFKFYFDSEHRLRKEKRPGWARLVERCLGAKNIRKLISNEGIKEFIVPDKWIYPLPQHPLPRIQLDKEQQLIVLLVTEMDLVSSEECRQAWKTKITPRHLDELYCILSHGFASTYLIANVSYTKQGKFACLDTEFAQRKLHYDRVTHYLSDEMQQYWIQLIKQGGQPN